MGFFKKLFGLEEVDDEYYLPHNTPYPMILCGAIPQKSADGKFKVKLGCLPDKEGQYLLFPAETLDWLIFMFVITADAGFTPGEGESGLGEAVYFDTALPAANYSVSIANRRLVIDKLVGTNKVRVERDVMLPDSWSFEFSIARKRFKQEAITEIIIANDYIAYRLVEQYEESEDVNIHSIIADQSDFDYVRWDDGTSSGGDEGESISGMEIPLMLPHEMDQRSRCYWRP